MEELAETLARGQRVERRTVLVVAHPDDETVGFGGHLGRFDDLVIVHLTDGAPADPADARRAGCASPAEYAALRRRELDRAIDALGAAPRRVRYGATDQDTIGDLRRIADALVHDLGGAAAVITHPYEHGHPDHDTAALAVALACARLGPAAPARFEVPSYHLRGGLTVLGAFWPDGGSPETILPLDDAQLAAKRAALACFGSQADMLGSFPLEPERIRPAPCYDFRAPAPPGEAWYDRFGWRMTSARWRGEAVAALDLPQRCA